jgi:hypothetical protein
MSMVTHKYHLPFHLLLTMSEPVTTHPSLCTTHIPPTLSDVHSSLPSLLPLTDLHHPIHNPPSKLFFNRMPSFIIHSHPYIHIPRPTIPITPPHSPHPPHPITSPRQKAHPNQQHQRQQTKNNRRDLSRTNLFPVHRNRKRIASWRSIGLWRQCTCYYDRCWRSITDSCLCQRCRCDSHCAGYCTRRWLWTLSQDGIRQR